MKRTLLLSILVFFSFVAWTQQGEEPAYYLFSIYFGGGSYYISPDQEQGLVEWLNSIPEVENHAISIHGHTDDIGSYEYNQWLSHMRCQATLQRLVEYGLDPDTISIEDFGELNPVYDNATWEGKLKNRRVDVIIRPVEM